LRVDHLGLEDFRNYEHAEVELDAHLNVIVGPNAHGKTNLLEAVYCLGGLGSPRGPDAALIRDGAERALLHADIRRGPRSVRLDMEVRPGRGVRALINRTPVGGGRALRELSTAVFFGPDELSLVKGSPEGRRRFLDDLIVKLRPARETVRREWDRVQKQRNALLRSVPRAGEGRLSARQTLAVWDEAFSRAGAHLAAARLQALGRLIPFARKRYEAIAGRGSLELTYASSWLDGETAKELVSVPQIIDETVLRTALERALEEVRERELERGVSLAGPQRDDVLVRLAAASGEGPMLDARAYASQGDQRSCALALKLAEYDLLTEALSEEPIMLLDDVFSELDWARRGYLVETIGKRGQTIVSSAEPGVADLVPGRVFDVASGRVTARER
jgi:DNA replication and repair protein RecF